MLQVSFYRSGNNRLGFQFLKTHSSSYRVYLCGWLQWVSPSCCQLLAPSSSYWNATLSARHQSCMCHLIMSLSVHLAILPSVLGYNISHLFTDLSYLFELHFAGFMLGHCWLGIRMAF